jgi:hypothetical protein
MALRFVERRAATVPPPEHPHGEQPSVWAPLRNPVYRTLLMASFGFNIGNLNAGRCGAMVSGREPQP